MFIAPISLWLLCLTLYMGTYLKKRQAIQTKQTLEKVIFFQVRAKQKADIDKKTKNTPLTQLCLLSTNIVSQYLCNTT